MLLAESRGVEPHPISENLVFKASRRTIPAALLSRIVERVERIELSRYPWQGHRLPLHHTRKNLAETERFELSVRITAYDRLATCCLRPLGHVSNVVIIYSNSIQVNQNQALHLSLRAVRFNTRSPPVTCNDDD